MPTPFPLAAHFARALPDWVPDGAGLSGALNLEDGRGAPAERTLTAQGTGPSAPVAFVAFVASLPFVVPEPDWERASATLAAWSRTEVVLGTVELSAGGRLRYRWTHGPIGSAWTTETAGAFTTGAFGAAEAALGPAVRALETVGIEFDPALDASAVPTA